MSTFTQRVRGRYASSPNAQTLVALLRRLAREDLRHVYVYVLSCVGIVVSLITGNILMALVWWLVKDASALRYGQIADADLRAMAKAFAKTNPIDDALGYSAACRHCQKETDSMALTHHEPWCPWALAHQRYDSQYDT